MPTPSGTTPQYGFPYLLESDVPDVATASQLLAQAVENLLKTTRIGTLFECLTASAPTGSVFLQGQAVSRTTYATLFAKWGTTYGSGNGSTTFNLPDFRGKGPVGYKSGTSNFGTLGASVGSATVTLATGNIPRFATVSLSIAPHTHSGTTGAESGHEHLGASNTYQYMIDYPASTNHLPMTTGSWGVSFSSNTGTSTGHHHSLSINNTTASGAVSFGSSSPTPISTVQPSIVVNFAVWYE